MASVKFVIGNTYAKIDRSRAMMDRSETFYKVHDWTLYVDILADDADLIRKVEFNMGSTFEPTKFVSHCPIKVPGSKSTRWRFQTRQQSYGRTSNVKIAITGRGGTVLRRDYRIKTSSGAKESDVGTFLERRPDKGMIPVPMADVNFGIELELSSSSNVLPGDVARSISSNSSVVVEDMTSNYTGARNVSNVWVLMTDPSLTCSAGRPYCNKFELVSRILGGERGLDEIDRVVRAVGSIPSIKVNSSMGFHVHVNVSKLTLGDLIKVCQNFVKYESAMDRLMPPSRREGGSAQQWCQSNILAVAGSGASVQQVHEKLASCRSVRELGSTMSPSKFYKLNMQPLVTGRQPTVEFRQHSSTYNKDKVKNWIRFCVGFVHNSAKFRVPSHLSKNVTNEELFEMMMMYVVKDRFLRDFYRKRRDAVAQSSDCCDGCGTGSGCVANRALLGN